MASVPWLRVFLACSRRMMKGLPYYIPVSIKHIAKMHTIKFTSSVAYTACGSAIVVGVERNGRAIRRRLACNMSVTEVQVTA